MTAAATPATLPAIDQKGYAHPEMLVSTEWLAANLNDPSIRIIESDEDVLLYDMGHIPGAVHIDWRGDLQDNTQRDYVSPERFAEVAGKNGITPETTVVFYGDKAKNAFRKALALDPKLLEARMQMVFIYLTGGQKQKARAEIGRAHV